MSDDKSKDSRPPEQRWPRKISEAPEPPEIINGRYVSRDPAKEEPAADALFHYVFAQCQALIAARERLAQGKPQKYPGDLQRAWNHWRPQIDAGSQRCGLSRDPLSLQKIATLDFQWNEAGGLREKVQGPDGAAEGENDELKKKQWYIWPGKILTPGQNGVFEAHKAIWPDGNITEQPRDRDLKILAWIKSQSGKFPILRATTPKSSAEGYVQPTIKAARTKFNFGYPPH